MENQFQSIIQASSSIESKLKKNAPVRTGALKSSIISSYTNDNISVDMLDYGKYVNAKTAFIDDAIDNSELNIIADNIANDMINDVINKLI